MCRERVYAWPLSREQFRWGGEDHYRSSHRSAEQMKSGVGGWRNPDRMEFGVSDDDRQHLKSGVGGGQETAVHPLEQMKPGVGGSTRQHLKSGVCRRDRNSRIVLEVGDGSRRHSKPGVGVSTLQHLKPGVGGRRNPHRVEFEVGDGGRQHLKSGVGKNSLTLEIRCGGHVGLAWRYEKVSTPVADVDVCSRSGFVGLGREDEVETLRQSLQWKWRGCP